MNILYVLNFIIGLTIFVLLITQRKKFDQSGHKLSLITKLVLGLISIIVLFVFSSSIGTIYYYAYHPDYKLKEASSKTEFHIYVPSYIPNGMEQRTIFRVLDKTSSMIAGQPTISWAYGMPLLTQAKSGISVLTVRESKVDKDFVINDFLTNMEQQSSTSGKFEIVKQNSLVGTTYMRLMKLNNGKVVGPSIYLLTSDGVLINVNSTATEEDTLKLVESLK